MNNWLSMKSAPKDGTRILAYMPEDNMVDIIKWLVNYTGIKPGWFYPSDDGILFRAEPAAWQPLPDPPEDIAHE